MWVAQRVHIPHRPGDLPGRDVQNTRPQRRVEVAAGPDLDSGISTLTDERWQPANLQVSSNSNQQICAVQLEYQTGLGLDEVRILIAAPQSFHADPVAANLARERRQILGGSHHGQGRLSHADGGAERT